MKKPGKEISPRSSAMKNQKSLPLQLIVLLISLLFSSCSPDHKDSSASETPAPTLSKTELEDEAWHMEELYWEYVQNIDTVPYKTLWHHDFIGYPVLGMECLTQAKLPVGYLICIKTPI
jgi:hypothetical protein